MGRRQELLEARRRRRTGAGHEPAIRSAGEGQAPRVRGRRRAPTPRIPIPSPSSLASSPARIVGLVATLTVLLVFAHFAFSGRYVVESAVVLGADRVEPEAVIEAAGIRGHRAYRLSAAEVARRVERHPRVKSATVAIRLPAQVWIRITETQPVLRWITGGNEMIVDENGLADVGPAPPGLTTVNDPGAAIAAPGDRLPREAVGAALSYAPHFETLEYRKLEGFVGTTSRGWQVLLGADPSRAPMQLATLESVEARMGGGDVSVVDLRFDRPYYRLASYVGGSR